MQIKDYKLGTNIVRYMIDENENVSLTLIPDGLEDKFKNSWERDPAPFNPRARYTPNRESGHLAYFQLAEQNICNPCVTMKSNPIAKTLKFKAQESITDDDTAKIITTLESDEGYTILHTLTYHNGLRGFEVETEFINNSGKTVTLQMLTSFVLDNLSPFQSDDAPNKYRFHRFYGGWSLEGKHCCQTIEELALEKTWAGWNSNSEKFGCKGSYPVKRYFPTASFEDTELGVHWTARLAHNATWQMELTRCCDFFSFSGGVGDFEFCGWEKNIENGASFKAPKAYISAVSGDIDDACAAVTDMHKPAYKAHGEDGLPICFNEYCVNWGRPTQDKILNFCNTLKGIDIKYLVIDAGWCKEGCEQDSNGEWNIDKNIFPDMLAMNNEIRRNGMIPGIWFEFEVTTKGSAMFEAEYDHMHLTRGGRVLKTNDFRSYWDFRRSDVREYLHEKVINFLKKYNFGYIKVDYNANIGHMVDGAESGAEALRQHLEAVRDFFAEMKREIPDLIIENCASGGHRLEPSMMAMGAVSSFSDAHECVEIPYIAANLHRLMLPAQELIWAVLHDDDSNERLAYSLAATFLGRMCLSGKMDTFSVDQLDVVNNALSFYRLLDDVIINGDSKIYGNRGRNTRYPTGTQAVVRNTDKEMLVVCHSFENPSEEFSIEIPKNAKIKASFCGDRLELSDGKLTVNKMNPFTAGAVLLEI